MGELYAFRSLGGVLAWGAAVIADSAPFSGLAARFCEAPYMGTALTVQNGIGFAVTVVSIQVTALAASLIGVRRDSRAGPKTKRMAGFHHDGYLI